MSELLHADYWQGVDLQNLPVGFATAAPQFTRYQVARKFADVVDKLPVDFSSRETSSIECQLLDQEIAVSIEPETDLAKSLGLLVVKEHRLVVKISDGSFEPIAVEGRPDNIWYISARTGRAGEHYNVWGTTYPNAFVPKYLNARTRTEKEKLKTSVQAWVSPLVLGKFGYIHPKEDKAVLLDRQLIASFPATRK